MSKTAEKVDAKKDRSESAKESRNGNPNHNNVERMVPREPVRDPARDSALSRAVQQIEKQFGKGAVMKLDGENIQPIEGIPTGSLSLDIALGGAGIPRGRVVEIFGPESSGKTTLCLHIVASAQKLGGVAAFIDAEHALDPS